MIDKKTPLFEIIQNYPQSREIFKRHGMGCPSCMGAAAENLEEAAHMHGIDLDLLIKELEAVVTQS